MALYYHVDNEEPKQWTAISNAVLIGLATTCFSAMAYFTYYYVWTRERRFTSLGGLILNVVLPAVIALCLVACLRLRSSYKINLAILCASLTCSVYGADILLSSKLASEFGLRNGSTNTLNALDDLRLKGIDAAPLIAPSYLLEEGVGGVHSAMRLDGAEVLPLGGIARKTTFHCDENGQHLTYESDEQGFNNPPGIWQFQSIDVAILGNSFTQGYCVSNQNHFVAVIRSRYPATLNLGMDGSGPLLELAALKEFLPAYAPKIVLWVYFEDFDLLALEKEKRSSLLMSYLQNGFSQGLRSKETAIDAALVEFAKKQESSRLATSNARNTLRAVISLSTLRQELGLISGEISKAAPKAPPPDLELFGEVLRQAASAVRSYNGQFYFVYLPGWPRYGNLDNVNPFREQVLNLVAGLHISTIDMHPRFLMHGDPLSLFPSRRQPGHYNEEGYGLVGDEILKAIAPIAQNAASQE